MSLRDRISWGRALLLAPLLWWTVTLGSGHSTWCFLDCVNLPFHEAGHLFLRPFGRTVHLLGGALGQLLVPALLAGWFLIRERKPFAAAVCSWWVGQSLINTSIYMADARSLNLPLVGGGDHDWNNLLFQFGLLTEPAVRNVSGATHLLGLLIMLAGLGWAGLFVLPEETRSRLAAAAAERRPWLGLLLDA